MVEMDCSKYHYDDNKNGQERLQWRMKSGYKIDESQQKVTVDTLMSVHVSGELKNVADNYLMSDGDDQNNCEHHYPQKKKTDNKLYAELNELDWENKQQLGRMHSISN